MNVVARYRREISVALSYGLLLFCLGLYAPDFYHAQFRATWVTAAPMLVVAIGMTLVILSRQIDISIGSQFSVCGIIAALAAKAGFPMPCVWAITISTGGLLGAANGVLVAAMGLPSIVATLATMVIVRESLRWAREGEPVRSLPSDFQWFGQPQVVGQWTIMVIALAVWIAFAWGLRYVSAGRAVYAVGSDQEAARLSGIRPRRVIFMAFVTMGLLTGLASLLGCVRFANVDPNAGNGLELQVIAAVVVGGTAISGGRGTLVGTLVGVALLGTIGSALVFFKAQPQWEKAIQGMIILMAVASEGMSNRSR
jgi:rhamnose transport system permease protein